MAEEKAEAAQEESSSNSGSGTSKIVTIIAIVNLLATLGIGGVLFLSYQKEKKAESIADLSTEEAHGEEGGHGEKGEKKEGGEHGEAAGGHDSKENVATRMINLDQFTINLNTPGSVAPKFVRVNISLEIPSEDTEKEVQQKMPQVRNVIIDLFNSKRTQDMASPEGREFLKEEIQSALNSFLMTGKIKGVYFTNFALSS